ncbi:MAG: glycoside hydrolase [Anaerolineae bacterium]|nr:glycoside hydrolase [Anaerolineae bacterium]
MIDWYATYIENPNAARNPYRGLPPRMESLPGYVESRPHLPQPFWDGHDSAIACYWKVWELAFRNLKLPTTENGFVSPYIDTAFNGNLFLWDSAFILMFCRYASRAFNFQQTLDNFYCKQHPDGFICREIRESDGSDCFKRFDPPATGPEVLPWVEWEYFLNFGDQTRLERVFPVLLAYHQWMKHYRTWQDGTYWATGWACGMDNQPRLSVHRGVAAPDGPVEWWDHDHMTWVDATFQALHSARILARMAQTLSLPEEAARLHAEAEALQNTVRTTLWHEASGFYYDRFADGTLSTVKTIGAYWALLAENLPVTRRARFIAHLEDPGEFKRAHRAPSLSANHPDYNPAGGYWRGSVWAPTNYMLLRGLSANGLHDLAHEIGSNHHANVVRVFEQTGTLWENYAPDHAAPGSTAAGEFVGWTGLPPTAVLLEYVFGLRPDVPNQRMTWDVRLLEAHGVQQYPIGAQGLLDLRCEARAGAQEKPRITASANLPLTLEILWSGGREIMAL